jgi:hypothetical protein
MERDFEYLQSARKLSRPPAPLCSTDGPCGLASFSLAAPRILANAGGPLRHAPDLRFARSACLAGSMSYRGTSQPIAIARTRSLACARRGAGFKPRAKRCLDGNDEAIVHADELLARPVALQLVAGPARSASKEALPIQRRTAAVHEGEGVASPATLRRADRQIKRQDHQLRDCLDTP